MTLACDRGKGVQSDAWISPRDTSLDDAQRTATPVARDNVVPVDAAHRDEAERMLDSHPWVELADSTAATLTGVGPRAPDDGKHRFLLRAVKLDGSDPTGTITVAQGEGGDVFVHWACSGHPRNAVLHQPVVAVLPREPHRVLVTTCLGR